MGLSQPITAPSWRPPVRWRSFLVGAPVHWDTTHALREGDTDIHHGYGLTLEAVIQSVVEAIEDTILNAATQGSDPHRDFSDNCDLTIWENGHLVALVRCIHGQPGPEVVRFDGEARAYIVPLEVLAPRAEEGGGS